MVIVKLIGGLGNQLFQYAFGRMVAIKNNERLYLDTSSFTSDYLGRQNSLTAYTIKAKFINNRYFQKIITSNTCLNQVFQKSNLLDERVEVSFTINELLLTTNKFITIYSGFWQSHKYFGDIRKVLLQELRCNSKAITKSCKQLQFDRSSVAVHVRRTDYIHHPSYGFLGNQYYYDAMKILNEKVRNARFFIFSDDINWCKENFSKDFDIIYVSGNHQLKDYEELLLMSKCSHHIIANSSFSWWGAWLCQNEEQLVIRPSNPYKDISLLYEDHYPDNWNKLSNEYGVA